MEETRTEWDAVKQLYKDKFGVEGHLVDYVAVNEILRMCVSGISNERICQSLGLDGVYVSGVIWDYLGFHGWALDLDLDPWRIFCSVTGNKWAFAKKIEDLTELLNNDIIEVAYRICSIYNSIQGEIEKFYERS